MNQFRLSIILLLPVFLAACSFGKNTVNLEEVKKIKNVAVIMYTVPEQITYRADARDNSTGLLAALVETSIGKNGNTAADTAIRTFTQTLQNQELPFNIMPHSKVISNAQFTALYQPASKTETKAETGFLGKFISNVTSDKSIGASPSKMNQYGLVASWSGDTALTNKGGESNYIAKSIEALKVDAVLVVNDPGFSFSCEACIGAASAMNGVASTGSAFNATLVTRTGPVMNIREWFATTDEQGAMVAGIVDPTEHKELFEEHGRKMAQVFAMAVKESMAPKK
ncbi:MAG: hypothetical protein OEZ38_01170 [Gammaproteobacteria bacterium]|nr:hypothetical protein [Gammaproteobacteria bacterium]